MKASIGWTTFAMVMATVIAVPQAQRPPSSTYKTYLDQMKAQFGYSYPTVR